MTLSLDDFNEIHFFGDDEYLKVFLKDKGINKKHSIDIFNIMSKEQFVEVMEQDIIGFLEKIIS